jgi:hypothetical protein
MGDRLNNILVLVDWTAHGTKGKKAFFIGNRCCFGSGVCFL